MSAIVLLAMSIFLFTVQYYKFGAGGNEQVLKLICSASFSISAYFVVKSGYEFFSTRWTSPINYLGKNTLEIYLTHFFVVEICTFTWIDVSNVNAIPLFVILFLVSIPVGLLVVGMANVLKAIPYLSLFIYGRTPVK